MLRWMWPLPRRRWPVAVAVVVCAMGAGCVMAHFGGFWAGVVAFAVAVGEVLAVFCARSWLRSRRQAREAEAHRDRTDELITM